MSSEQPEDAPLVVYVELVYPLAGRPAALAIRPPMRSGARYVAANIGFVVYHDGLPVTDFRYLGAEETLDRSRLFAAQTPQCFRAALLSSLLERAQRLIIFHISNMLT